MRYEVRNCACDAGGDSTLPTGKGRGAKLATASTREGGASGPSDDNANVAVTPTVAGGSAGAFATNSYTQNSAREASDKMRHKLQIKTVA